jgi:hypothetical protein
MRSTPHSAIRATFVGSGSDEKKSRIFIQQVPFFGQRYNSHNGFMQRRIIIQHTVCFVKFFAEGLHRVGFEGGGCIIRPCPPHALPAALDDRGARGVLLLSNHPEPKPTDVRYLEEVAEVR